MADRGGAAPLPAHSPIEVTPSGSPAKAGLGVATKGEGATGWPQGLAYAAL